MKVFDTVLRILSLVYIGVFDNTSFPLFNYMIYIFHNNLLRKLVMYTMTVVSVFLLFYRMFNE